MYTTGWKRISMLYVIVPWQYKKHNQMMIGLRIFILWIKIKYWNLQESKKKKTRENYKMNQQEQEFLREKQKILKSMPDSVAFSREEAKLLETMTEELLEYKRICSLSELKMLCEDAERYAALDDALFLYSEERSEKNCLKQDILDTLTNITKRYKNKNKESEEKTMNINIVKGRGLWRGITIETREFVEGYYVYDLARRRSVIYKNESIAPDRGTILKSYERRIIRMG